MNVQALPNMVLHLTRPSRRHIVAPWCLHTAFKLCEDAGDAGFAFEEKLGPSFAYFARFGTLHRTT
jgi:hypothetical protein